MQSKWMEVKLSEITTKITKGTTPTTVGGGFVKSGVNFIKSESITSNRRLDSSKYTFIDEITHEKLKRSQIKESDVLFSIAGVYLGKTAIVYQSDLPANTNQAVAIIRIDTEKADHEYVYYWLNNKAVYDYINNSVAQSAQPNFNLKQVGDISILCPPIQEQWAIAATLSCLDDKIELNNKINDNLEAQAQAIFKSWFVDFEPWDGVMPDDWREGCLADVCDYCSDKVPVSALSLNTYISTENMLPNKTGFVNATNLPTTLQTTSFKDGDILISNIRPYFKKIIYCDFDGGCSTDVLCFRASQQYASLFLYCALCSDRFFDYMVAGSKGTKMPRGDKQQVMKYALVIPNAEALSEFSSVISPFMKNKSLLTAESRTLAVIRDTLLPKLMSREIEVPIQEVQNA